MDALQGNNKNAASRFKVFTWPEYREIVTDELFKQVVDAKLAQPNPRIKYCLVAGKIATDRDRNELKAHFKERDWILCDEDWLK